MKKKKRASVKKKAPPPSLLRYNSTGAPLAWPPGGRAVEATSQCFALFILTLFPLMMGPNTYVTLTENRFTLFAVTTCLYAGLCLVLLAAERFAGRRTARQGVTLPQVFLLLYAAWALVSAVASPYGGLWLGQSRYEGLFSLLLYATLFWLLSFWGAYTDGYVYGLAIMALLAGFTGAIQTLGATVLYPQDMDYWSTEFLSTAGNQDCLAGLICVALPTLLCGCVLLRDKKRWLGLPGLFFMSYLALYTGVDTAKCAFLVAALLLPCLAESRERLQNLLIALTPLLLGAGLGLAYHSDRTFTPAQGAPLLAAAAAAGLAAWALRRREKTWALRPATVRRIGYGLMAAAAVAAVVAVYRYRGDSVLLQEAAAFLHGQLGDRAGTNRGYLWKTTVGIIRQRPILGGGPGSFAALFAPYIDQYQAITGRTDIIDFPHNDFLCVAATTGLVGLGLYLLFLISLAVRCLRALGRSPLPLLFLAGLAGYLCYAFFVFSLAIVSPLFWALAGLADKCVRQLTPAEE